MDNMKGRMNFIFIGDLKGFSHLLQIPVRSGRLMSVYQLAARLLGGAGYIFRRGMMQSLCHNSATINLNMAEVSPVAWREKNINFPIPSSSCLYSRIPTQRMIQIIPNCSVGFLHIQTAAPDSDMYGWDKLFSVRLYLAVSSNYGLGGFWM
jgi:hypothetical protein